MMLTLASCGDSPAVSEFKPLDTSGWHQRDTLVFRLQRADTTSQTPAADMHLHLMLRTLPACDISGVTLLAEVVERTDPRCSRHAHTPSRRVLLRDTIPFTLTTSTTTSTGMSIRCLDSSRDITLPLHPSRSYFLRVTHIMRLDPIEGLTEVGYQMQ